MAAPMSTMHQPGRQSLVLLPNELLLRIVDALPDDPNAFLPLMHSCRFFRLLITAADSRLFVRPIYDVDGPFGLLMDLSYKRGWATRGLKLLPPMFVRLMWLYRSATDFRELAKTFEKPAIYDALFSVNNEHGIFYEETGQPSLKDTSHPIRFIRSMFMLSRSLAARRQNRSPFRTPELYLFSPSITPLHGALIQYLDEFCHAITRLFILPRIRQPTHPRQCNNLLLDCAIAWGPRVLADVARSTAVYESEDAFITEFVNHYWRKGLDFQASLNLPLAVVRQGSALGDSTRHRNHITLDNEATAIYLHLFTTKRGLPTDADNSDDDVDVDMDIKGDPSSDTDPCLSDVNHGDHDSGSGNDDDHAIEPHDSIGNNVNNITAPNDLTSFDPNNSSPKTTDQSQQRETPATRRLSPMALLQRERSEELTRPFSFQTYENQNWKRNVIRVKLNEWAKRIPDDEALVRLMLVGKDGRLLDA